MGVELSQASRFLCKCGKGFRLSSDFKEHQSSCEDAMTSTKGKSDVAPPAETPKLDFLCYYPDCKYVSDCKVGLQDHLEEDHDYCRVCDVTFENWDELLKHKITMGPPKHTCCPICSLDFKSVGGMERHVKIFHPRNQKITCRGCNRIFANASRMVAHLERGKCHNDVTPGKSITKDEFRDSVHHKLVVEHILNHPDPSKAFTGPMGTSQSFGFQSNGSQNIPRISRQADESVRPIDVANDELEKCSIARGLEPSNAENRDTAPAHTQGRESDVGGPSVKFESKGSGVWVASISSTKRLLQEAEPASGSHQPQTAASFNAQLQMLEKDYVNKYKTRKNPIEAVLSQRDSAAPGPSASTKSAAINLFSQERFWHPSHPSFSAEWFFNADLKCYCCPFMACNFQTASPTELSMHIQHSDVHDKFRKNQCPICTKVFKSSSALIAHCESPSMRCNVKNMAGYAEFIDKLSGGYVNVKYDRYERKDKQKSDESNSGGEEDWKRQQEKIVDHITRYDPRYEASKPRGGW